MTSVKCQVVPQQSHPLKVTGLSGQGGEQFFLIAPSSLQSQEKRHAILTTCGFTHSNLSLLLPFR
jgi:hypothetical protein